MHKVICGRYEIEMIENSQGLNMGNADKAAAMFKEGFSCSQAVLGTYCEQFGLDKKQACKISCGFGGGMHIDQTCGAGYRRVYGHRIKIRQDQS